MNYLIARCAEFGPELFMDIGANIRMYSCILLRKHSVPRAILFEPDRRNLIHLRANLLMNGLLEPSRLNEFQQVFVDRLGAGSEHAMR